MKKKKILTIKEHDKLNHFACDCPVVSEKAEIFFYEKPKKILILKSLRPIFRDNGRDDDGEDLYLYVREERKDYYIVSLHENYRFGDLEFGVKKSDVIQVVKSQSMFLMNFIPPKDEPQWLK